MKKSHSVRLFLTLFKLNITFYVKCYLHHNCSINLNWNNTQIYSSSKPLHNVPSSAFWFANFCFLPFLCRTSVQKWKKNKKMKKNKVANIKNWFSLPQCMKKQILFLKQDNWRFSDLRMHWKWNKIGQANLRQKGSLENKLWP